MGAITVKNAAGETVTIPRTAEDLYAVLTDPTPAAVVSLEDIVSASFPRDSNTTALTVGDVLANTTVAANVVPMAFDVGRIEGGTGSLRRLRLFVSSTGWLGAQIRMHMFRNAPTLTGGDNAPFAANGVAALYMGALDVTLDRLWTDGVSGIGLPVAGSEITFKTLAPTTGGSPTPGSKLIYGVPEARSVFTLVGSEVITARFETFKS